MANGLKDQENGGSINIFGGGGGGGGGGLGCIGQ